MALEFPQNLSTKFNVELKVESQNSKKDFENLQEYTKYLSDKYGVNAGQRMISGVPTTINVSSAFIKEAFENPDKRKFLEENLEAISKMDYSGVKGKLISQAWNINEKGEISAMSVSVSSSDSKNKSLIERLLEELKEQEKQKKDKADKNENSLEKIMEKLRELNAVRESLLEGTSVVNIKAKMSASWLDFSV